MKKSVLLTVVFLLMASIGFSQMTDVDAKVEETITAKEKEIYEAIKKGDMETFKAYTSDDLLSIYNNGYANKDQEVETLGSMTMDSYELSDIRVLQPAKGTAIIVYTLNASGIYNDQEFTGTFYATSTWTESDGDWKAILHTQTEHQPMDETVSMEEEQNN